MPQASKYDLQKIAEMLGCELSLHLCIVRLCPGVSREAGAVHHRQRMAALKKLAGVP